MNAPVEQSHLNARTLVQTRLIDAPVALVYAAFTDPKHIGLWWGPRGFRTTTQEMDVKVGGIWQFVMHGPDGTDWPNKITYLEVDAPNRLVYEHGDYERVHFHVTVTFEARDGKTQLTMRSLFPSLEALEAVKKFGAVEGGRQTVDRLVEYLGGGPNKHPDFVITRHFKAPRELVFAAWTQAEHLAKWFGPVGMKLGIPSFDLRPGGHFHYTMTHDDGTVWWGRFIFEDIIAPERLVFVNGFSDEKMGATRAPFEPKFPLEMRNVVTFTEEDGITTVTLRGNAYKANEEEQDMYFGFHASMQQGWGGSFDVFDAYLQTLQR